MVGVSRLSKISNYHNCWNLFSLLFSCFSDTKSSLSTCTASSPENSYKRPDCFTQDRKTERERKRRNAEKGRGEEEKSTLKICKSNCLGWGALTSVSRIAASIFSVCMCVWVHTWVCVCVCVCVSLSAEVCDDFLKPGLSCSGETVWASRYVGRNILPNWDTSQMKLSSPGFKQNTQQQLKENF